MVSGIKGGWYAVYCDGITLGIIVHARVYARVRARIGMFVCLCAYACGIL